MDFFKLYKCNILIKYYDQINNELDLKNVFKKLEINRLKLSTYEYFIRNYFILISSSYFFR